MESQKKNKNVHTKEMLIRSIAKECHRDITTVRVIYNTLEENIAKHLSSANSDTDVSVRLFEGITIDSMFIPEKTKVNNLTGKVITSTSKIKPKANITRSYCKKITTYNK